MHDLYSFQVDERAVLKHFNWPEQKADALREAAFGYCDLKKLESEATTFRDDARQHCGPALKKMQALLEKYANFFSLALCTLPFISLKIIHIRFYCVLCFNFLVYLMFSNFATNMVITG